MTTLKKIDIKQDEKKDGKKKRKEFATLTMPDGTVCKLPLLGCTDGPSAIDVRGLYNKLGIFTYDPGFTSTCSCSSSITYIDGPKGILAYRGYKIEDLCNYSNYYEVTYLLLNGELPNKKNLTEFQKKLNNHTMVHTKLIKFFDGFKSDAHPMSIMVSVVGALSSFYNNNLDITKSIDREISTHRLIAKMATIAAIAYKTSIGQPIVYPRNDLSYSENFLYMMFAVPCEEYKINPTMAKAIEVFLILHADHEQNASTSTVRIAGSSLANPFACISSGIAALWGPAHGGANEAVIRMLQQIKTKERIPLFIKKAKDKNDPFRLMGFGHRVYKNYDPRAKVMRKMCYQLIEESKMDNEPLLDLAIELEKIALSDEYFIKRKLFPNVDFYSGIALKAMGIPLEMYTVLFAVGRTVGWVSQWKEMITDKERRIGRPRQLYKGSGLRSYEPMDKRKKNDTVLEEKA